MGSKVVASRVSPKPFDEEVLKAVENILKPLGGPEAFAGPGDKVLIKPNICSDNLWITADRRVYYALAVLFSNAGCKVIIGENPVIDTPSRKLYESEELKRVAEKAGVKVVNFRFDEFVKVRVPEAKLYGEIELSKYVVEADVLVNVPTMRKHGLSGLTLSIKNLYGLVSLRQRYIMHSRSLYWGLIDIAKAVKDKLKLTVMDGILATTNGVLAPIGLVLASTDFVALDTVAAKILGWDPMKLETIKYAYQEKLGEADPEKIELEGISWKDVSEYAEKYGVYFESTWPKPEEVAAKLGKVEVISGTPCPTCERNVAKVLSTFKLEDFENSPEIAIIVGPEAKPVPRKTNIIVGECLKKYAGEGVFVGCCPTYTHDIKAALEYVLGKTNKFIRLWDKLLDLLNRPI